MYCYVTSFNDYSKIHKNLSMKKLLMHFKCSLSIIIYILSGN